MTQSSDEKNKRRLIQIGFAALMARKRSPHKQYLYESRGENEFVFEPVLKQNEADMNSEEYMKKKYYSQVVYEAARAGDLQTSISSEGGTDEQAARRLWAGRKGTGWAGTGKGGYMESLQPGIAETRGTGAGSARAEVDKLMQAYLSYQKVHLQPLKAMSQRATQDLFTRIGRSARAGMGTAGGAGSTTIEQSGRFKPYIAPAKAGGAHMRHPHQMLWYLAPHLSGLGASSTSKQNDEWIRKAVRKFEEKYSQAPFLTHRAVTSKGGYGRVYKGDMALHIAKYYPTLGDYDRLTKEVYRGKDTDYSDLDTYFADNPEFNDLTDDEISFLRDRHSRRGVLFQDTDNVATAGGGMLDNVGTAIGDKKLVSTVIDHKSLEDLFPKFTQSYLEMVNEKTDRDSLKEYSRGAATNNPEQIYLNNIQDVETYLLSMEATLNAELKRLGTSGLPGGVNKMIGKGSPMYNELNQGLLHSIIGDSFGSQKAQTYPEIADTPHPHKTVAGKDLIVNQSGGLLKLRVDALWTNPKGGGGYKNKGYYRVRISDIQFQPNVKHTLEMEHLKQAKGEEQLRGFKEVSDRLWNDGIQMQLDGQNIATTAGMGNKMFMGDLSPVNSVGYFTSTVSPKELSQRLEFLINTAAEEWYNNPEGFQGYFDLRSMNGGAFKEWALNWENESMKLQGSLNKKIQAKWQQWLSSPGVGGGVTAPPPRIAKTWDGPLHLGPFVHNTKYLGRARSVGKRKHGYYVHGDSVIQ